MIEFKITSSPDPEVIQTWSFETNEVTIGKDKGDMLIRDMDLLPAHIRLQVRDGQLILTLNQELDHITINGKRCEREYVLKPNDEIKISSTTIKLIRFQHNGTDVQQELIKKHEELADKSPEIYKLIQRLKADLESLSEGPE